MKVIAINGSPRKAGNTFLGLTTVGNVLQKHGIEFEVLHIGNKNIRGCLACGKCREMRNKTCTMTTDLVNQTVVKVEEADGLLLGSPVYYSGVAGTMKSFLDRLFYVAGANGGLFRLKVAAVVVAVRRSGGVATFDSLNHYLSMSEMVVPTSTYWNVVHGREPMEGVKDEEGIQTLGQLGENMAWLLKMINSTKEAIERPPKINKIHTSFIR